MIPYFPFSLLLSSACCLSHVAAFSPVSPPGVGASPSTSTLRASLKQLDDSNMSDLLFRPSEDKAVLVDAYAPWCGPCRMIEPHLEGCAQKYSDKLSVIKYDVEGNNNKDVKVEMLLQGVMVRGLPTLILYNKGSPLATHSGAITEVGLEEWLEDNLFSKMGEWEKEATIAVSAERKKQDEPKEDEPSAASGERGFVSLACPFDDYAL